MFANSNYDRLWWHCIYQINSSIRIIIIVIIGIVAVAIDIAAFASLLVSSTGWRVIVVVNTNHLHLILEGAVVWQRSVHIVNALWLCIYPCQCNLEFYREGTTLSNSSMTAMQTPILYIPGWDLDKSICLCILLFEHSEFRISYPADDEQQRPIAESVTYGWDWIKGAVVPFIGN